MLALFCFACLPSMEKCCYLRRYIATLLFVPWFWREKKTCVYYILLFFETCCPRFCQVLIRINCPFSFRPVVVYSCVQVAHTLRQVGVLQTLTLLQVHQLCDVLTEEVYEQGQKIITQVRPPTRHWICCLSANPPPLLHYILQEDLSVDRMQGWLQNRQLRFLGLVHCSLDRKSWKLL